MGMAREALAHLLQLALLDAHLQWNDVTLSAHGAAQQDLQVAVPVTCSVIVRHLGGRHVAVVSVELWDGRGTIAAGRNCKVRHNFGYRGPLLFGVTCIFSYGPIRAWGGGVGVVEGVGAVLGGGNKSNGGGEERLGKP